jgi:hypothetical protein
MNKKEYVDFFVEAIKKSEPSLYGDIDFDEEDGWVEDDELYFRFTYQIDDRVDRMDSEVEVSIQNIIGDEYGVIVDRLDAYPNGYAYYKVVIDK